MRSRHKNFFITSMFKASAKSNKAFRNLLGEIGARLADLRIKKGYTTIKEFVEKYDLPEIQYWRMEKGKSNLTLKSLMRILAIHNLSLQDFFCIIEGQHLS